MGLAQHFDFADLSELYKEFLVEFPFAAAQWNDYAQLSARKGDTRETLSRYTRGTSLNRRSMQLWECYCSWVQDSFGESNAELVRKTYDSALAQVGLDFFSGRIWQQYIKFEIQQDQPAKANSLFWRLVTIALQDLKDFVLRYHNFLEPVTEEHRLVDYVKALKLPDAIPRGVDALKAFLNQHYRSTSNKAIAEAQQRAKFEEVLPQTEFSGAPCSPKDEELWMGYIRLERGLNPQNLVRVLFTLEKSLTYCCTSKKLWREYVNYLVYQMKDEDYLKQALLSFSRMLTNVDANLVFLLADLLELESKNYEAKLLY